MGGKVLIAYATRYGATKIVAKEISKILKNKNKRVKLVNLKNGNGWPSPNNFDGVIVASSVAKFNLTKEAKSYIKKFKKDLVKKPFGFVFCSAESIMDEEKAIEKYVLQPLSKMFVKPDVVRGVGAYFDLSKNNKIGFLDKNILKSVALGIANSQKVKLKDKNDFLKYDRIEEFVNSFVKKIKN
jgi:menaquinone-dependent protoporphyrinogen IX oxidase